MLPCECCCDDKKVRDLEKKVNKAVYSVAVNGEIIYPSDGVGNVNLGNIGGSTDARDIKMPDGTSVAVAIEETQNDLTDKVSDVIPTPVTAGINLNETDGKGTVSRMLIRADDTLKFDGLNVGISEATDARITQAQADATTAGTKADDAQTDADTAQATADVAVKTLDTTKIIGDTTTLQLNVEKNNGNKGIIQLLADSDDIDMSASYGAGATVLKLKDALKEKINGAISAIGAGVVDSALEMNIEKADGSTATEPLFSIGDGLEWAENVLKATGGSGSAGEILFIEDTMVNIRAKAKVGSIIIYPALGYESDFSDYSPTTINIVTGTYGAIGYSGTTSNFINRVPFNLVNMSAVRIEFFPSSTAGGKTITFFIHSSDTGTTNIPISIDGADAIDATENVVSTTHIPVLSNVFSPTYVNSSEFEVITTLEYEGCLINYTFTRRINWLKSSTALYKAIIINP